MPVATETELTGALRQVASPLTGAASDWEPPLWVMPVS